MICMLSSLSLEIIKRCVFQNSSGDVLWDNNFVLAIYVNLFHPPLLKIPCSLNGNYSAIVNLCWLMLPYRKKKQIQQRRFLHKKKLSGCLIVNKCLRGITNYPNRLSNW